MTIFYGNRSFYISLSYSYGYVECNRISYCSMRYDISFSIIFPLKSLALQSTGDFWFPLDYAQHNAKNQRNIYKNGRNIGFGIHFISILTKTITISNSYYIMHECINNCELSRITRNASMFFILLSVRCGPDEQIKTDNNFNP